MESMIKALIMLIKILSFELKYRLKKPSTFIYFILLLFLGFMAIYRGSHGSGILRIIVTAGVGNVNANAPFALYYLITTISSFAILITIGFFGKAAFRDYQENCHELYFSYPIRKRCS